MMSGRADERYARALLALWIIYAVLAVVMAWPDILWLDMADTDDAMRLVQVRDWLAGQGWRDVTQYRMMPPSGVEIHWSRVVDLPLAAMIWGLSALLGHEIATQVAVVLVPLVTLLLIMLLAAKTARSVVAHSSLDPGAAAARFAGLFVLLSPAIIGIVRPMRIDHHGWQAALFMATLFVVLRTRSGPRDGILAALTIAISLAIGLETLPFLVLLLAASMLRWISMGAGAGMLQGLGAGLAVLVPLATGTFAVSAAGIAVCDALSVPYAVLFAVSGAGMALAATFAVRQGPGVRAAFAILVGALGYAAFLMYAPQCPLGPISGVDPRLAPWLASIGEARPFLEAVQTAPAPATMNLLPPLFGALAAIYLYIRRTMMPFAALALGGLNAAAFLMVLFVQVRVGALGAALSVVPLAIVAALWMPRVRASDRLTVRVLGTAGLLVGLTGIGAFGIGSAIAATRSLPSSGEAVSAYCQSGATLRPLNALPPSVIAAPMNVAPRLLMQTHHATTTGPYHRNADAILAMSDLWRVSTAKAHEILASAEAEHVLFCSGDAELQPAVRDATSFAGELQNGDTPDWLRPVELDGFPLDVVYEIKR
ncbi:MAG: hypothetical protein AAGD40_04335 [Pseudomonadota bacterium]